MRGLQTSHLPVDEGSVNRVGGYPPAFGGFYSTDDGKAESFKQPTDPDMMSGSVFVLTSCMLSCKNTCFFGRNMLQ